MSGQMNPEPTATPEAVAASSAVQNGDGVAPEAQPSGGETGNAFLDSRVEAIIAERERHFQSVADKRVAEAQRKAQAEIDALKALVQPQTQAPTHAQMNAAIDAGFTQAQIAEAWDNGTFPQLMARIASTTVEAQIEQRANAIFEEKMQRMQMQQQAAQEEQAFYAELGNIQKQYNFTHVVMQRICDTASLYRERFNRLPNAHEATGLALGGNYKMFVDAIVRDTQNPPAPPVRQAPPLIGDGGSAIPTPPKKDGPLRPGGFQGLM